MKKDIKIILQKLKNDRFALGLGAAVFLLALTAGIFILNSNQTPDEKSAMKNETQNENETRTETETLPVFGTKREIPIYCVDTDESKIALSFDAAWGNEYTETILDILDEQEVKATFFVTGQWLHDYPESVLDVFDRGHEIANHSLSHKEMSKMSEEEIEKDIMGIHKELKDLTGYEPTLFRPPYGDYDNEVILTAKKCGYTTVQWSVDSLDWKNYGVSNIIDTVTTHKQMENGAIILMHNGAKYTPEALEEVIIRLKEKGFSFVTVGELIYTKDYEIDAAGKQHKI